MNDTNVSGARCPICGEAAEVVQVSIEDGWSEAATHLVTIRACTNRYCEGHHPAVRQKVRAKTLAKFPRGPGCCPAAPTFDHQWPGPLRSTPVIRLGGGPIQLYG